VSITEYFGKTGTLAFKDLISQRSRPNYIAGVKIPVEWLQYYDFGVYPKGSFT